MRKDIMCVITDEGGRIKLWNVYPATEAEERYKEFQHIGWPKNTRLIPITDLIDETVTDIEAQVDTILSYCDSCVEVWRASDQIVISIEWGDWKHDHEWIDYLVSMIFDELKLDEESVTEEDGSDCYSSDHLYKIKKA